MKQFTFAKKRLMGSTLAALTIMGCMSAVAFAGEPNTVTMKNLDKAENKITVKAVKMMDAEMAVKLEVLGQGEAVDGGTVKIHLVKGEDGEMVQSMEAVYIDSIEYKIDEETGESFYSLDGGKTWEKTWESLEFTGEAQGMTYSIRATETQPAEAVSDK